MMADWKSGNPKDCLYDLAAVFPKTAEMARQNLQPLPNLRFSMKDIIKTKQKNQEKHVYYQVFSVSKKKKILAHCFLNAVRILNRRGSE